MKNAPDCDNCDDQIEDTSTSAELTVRSQSLEKKEIVIDLDEQCFEEILEESKTLKALIFADTD